MTREELQSLWRTTVRSEHPAVEQLDRVAEAIVGFYHGVDLHFRQHISNRLKVVKENTGQSFDPENFDLMMARAFIADEIGFRTWDDLVRAVNQPSQAKYPLHFQYAIAAMDRGDFTALETTLGPDRFEAQIRDWYEKGFFDDQPDTMAEIFSAACMLGHPETAEYMLDRGVDPYAGMKTGLSGFHYAASSGRLAVVKLLIERNVPMEARNMYGGTILGQALWSAVNEYRPDHASIIEALIDAGAVIEPGTSEWWEGQDVPDGETKRRVANALRNAGPR